MATLIQLFKALNANQYPGQIALSLTLGMVLGLTPLLSPHTLLTLLLILILRVNFAGVMVAWTFFTALAYLFDPLFHQLGLWVLSNPAWSELWTQAYNSAFWRWLNFNNTLVMGSVLVAYALAPVFLGVSWLLIRIYQQRFLVWVNRFKIVQMLKASEKLEVVSKVVS